MELFQAHNQWANRPADQRFETLTDLYQQTRAYAESAAEKSMPIGELAVVPVGNDLAIVGKAGNPATMTHWGFGQLAIKVGAPASYLRNLPPTLAATNMNHGIQSLADRNATAKLLFHRNGSMVMRAITSDEYARIWNYEIAERLLGLESRGWEPATPDKRFDGGDPAQCQMCHGKGNGGRVWGTSTALATGSESCQYCKGTGRAFPSLYASDHDMFAFVRNNSVVVREAGNPDGLQRGVIVSNSEVGAASLKLTKFLYREMCGNHIVWGASKVIELSVRHIGNARNRWAMMQHEVQRYAQESAGETENQIANAQRTVIAASKDEVLDKLFSMKSVGLSRKVLEAGYDANNRSQDGDPTTVWGMVQGLTRHSQKTTYADERHAVDRAAGRIMEANF